MAERPMTAEEFVRSVSKKLPGRMPSEAEIEQAWRKVEAWVSKVRRGR